MQAVKGQASTISTDRRAPLERGMLSAAREHISLVSLCEAEDGKKKQRLMQIIQKLWSCLSSADDDSGKYSVRLKK